MEFTPMKVERFDDVWDAIEATPAKAANMRARAQLMTAIRDTIEAWDITQSAAAKRLGLTQPRMNDLMRGRISKFSLDALMNLAIHAGLVVRVQIRRKAA
jgi:predicted XRE-type DNA-binding protein